MDQDGEPNMGKQGVDCSINVPHDGHSLLPRSPSKGLTSSELRASEQHPQVSASIEYTLGSSFLPVLNLHAGHVISKIEDLLLQMIDCILGERKELSLHLRPRPRSKTVRFGAEAAATRNSAKAEARMVRFPGRTAQEAWRFTVLLRILELSHEALVTGTIITKRDIYYKDPKLFLKQNFIDRYLDDIAFSLGVNRDSLNIVAAAKGLVIGYLNIVKIGEDVIDCRMGAEGILVPSMEEIERVDMHEARWVLVVEKEATFRSLAKSRFWETSPAGRGILVTGKGYPDIRTRALVQVLSSRDRFAGREIHCSHLRVFALVDYDPDGLAIMSTYKHGSVSLAHEHDTLVAPRIEWLGIKSNVIKDVHTDMSQDWVRLTSRDRTKGVKVLEKLALQGDLEPTWRRELQVMLILNVKAEIQILGEYSNLEDYLSSELQSSMSPC